MNSSELVERVKQAVGDTVYRGPDVDTFLADQARAAITATLIPLREHVERMEDAYGGTPGTELHAGYSNGYDDAVIDFMRLIDKLAAEILPAAAGTSDATEAGHE